MVSKIHYKIVSPTKDYGILELYPSSAILNSKSPNKAKTIVSIKYFSLINAATDT